MILRKIDENGLFIEDVITNAIPVLMEIVPVERVDTEGNPVMIDAEQPLLDADGNTIPDPHYIETPVPQGFYHPKWNGEQWVEGMAQVQIDELKNQPAELTPEQEELKMLKRRLDEAENTVVFLLDMNLMGGM